jgi:hypothetical protein
LSLRPSSIIFELKTLDLYAKGIFMIRTLLFSIAASICLVATMAFANESSEAPAHKAEHKSLVEEKKSKTATNFFPKKEADKSLATRPAAPELVEPLFMTNVTNGAVTLKWKEVPGSTNYHLQLATDPNFKWLVVNETLFTGTYFEAKNLEAGKHYYWRVAAQKGTNEPAYTKSAFNKSMFETH